MKKVKAVVALVLAIAMLAMPMAVAASTAEANEPSLRIVEGEAFVPLRVIANSLDAEVEWDRTIRAAIISFPDVEESLVVIIEAVGGFIEDGVAWVPIEFVEEVLLPILLASQETPRVDRIDTTLWDAENFADVREPMFSTEEAPGVIAVGFIEHMSDNLPARSPFTYAELDAALWIVEELLAMGHSWDNIAIQEFTYWDINDRGIGGLMPLHWGSVTAPWMLGVGRDYQIRQDRVSQNVVLIIPGQTSEKIIIGAHYDSPPYPSASDNASGTALLLESAQRMLETEHYYTLVYVFFGAEEVGLIGAYYYLESLTPRERNNIVMMVNADVIIEGPYLIYGAGSAPVLTPDEVDAILVAIFESMEDMLIAQFEGIMAEMEAMEIEDLIPVLGFDTLEGFIELVMAQLADISLDSLLMQASMMGLVAPVIDDVAAQVSAIAAELGDTHGFELISIPDAIAFSSDNLAFLFNGYTVVNLVGLERFNALTPAQLAQFPMANPSLGEFTVTILHSPLDNFQTIEEFWPGMMNANLEAFVLFLEAILTSVFN